jgi:hypothetical protein
MKKILVFLVLSLQSVYAQQRTTIKDSVLLEVLNEFIDELKLEQRQYKLIRVRLSSYRKERIDSSADTIKFGDHKAVEIKLPPAYDVQYALEVQYEINSKTIDWTPVTYYSIHRNISILFTTDIENLIEPQKNNKAELRRIVEKTSSPHVVGGETIWLVDVHNKKVTIRKPKSID